MWGDVVMWVLFLYAREVDSFLFERGLLMDLTVVRFPLELLGVGVLLVGAFVLIMWAVAEERTWVRYHRRVARFWSWVAVVAVSLGLVVTGVTQSHVMSRDVVRSEMARVYGIAVHETDVRGLTRDLTRGWFTHREAVFNNPPAGDIQYGSGMVIADGAEVYVNLLRLDGEWVIGYTGDGGKIVEMPRVE